MIFGAGAFFANYYFYRGIEGHSLDFVQQALLNPTTLLEAMLYNRDLVGVCLP
jgi:hypothetical protein